MSARVLVVEDEAAIADAVAYALRADGFDVTVVSDGETALAAVDENGFDVVVLDLMLPKLSGVEICRRIRADANPVPIIMLTAKDAEVDRVLGLETGADDYVTKPFSMAELVSRVRAILRRRQLDLAVGVRRIDGLEVDLVRHSVRVDDRTITLTPSEFQLLTLLASEPGRVFGRRELVRHLWQSEYTADARSCDMHVSNLRRKIGSDRIVTVRGVGYKLAGS